MRRWRPGGGRLPQAPAARAQIECPCGKPHDSEGAPRSCAGAAGPQHVRLVQRRASVGKGELSPPQRKSQRPRRPTAASHVPLYGKPRAAPGCMRYRPWHRTSTVARVVNRPATPVSLSGAASCSGWLPNETKRNAARCDATVRHPLCPVMALRRALGQLCLRPGPQQWEALAPIATTLVLQSPSLAGGTTAAAIATEAAQSGAWRPLQLAAPTRTWLQHGWPRCAATPLQAVPSVPQQRFPAMVPPMVPQQPGQPAAPLLAPAAAAQHSQLEWRADSVRRKRKRAMNRHKHRKRRRLNRMRK